MAGRNINDIGNKFFGGGGNTNDLRLATLQLATENGESLEITGGMKLEGVLESKPSLENTLVGAFPSGTVINMYQSTSNSAAVALPASAMVGKQPFVIGSLTYITGD